MSDNRSILTQLDEEEIYFWGVHAQGELDLLLIKGGKRFGFEVKYADSPKRSAIQKTAHDTLGLESLVIVNPGKADYPLEPGIRVTPQATTPASRKSLTKSFAGFERTS